MRLQEGTIEIKIEWSFQLCPFTSGDDEEHIRLWDKKTRQQKLRLDGHTSSVRPVYYFSGNKLSSVNWDNSIQLRNVNLGQQIQPLHNSFQDKLAYLLRKLYLILFYQEIGFKFCFSHFLKNIQLWAKLWNICSQFST
ncbi:unnamed protein product [Paramecium primaurelia]|uniref:Uncharacterized protein n=1 Tax=Paramecium primaurelia TaxID=5886 RepID=A0A8S1QQK8_PARPR|nr:unnamed protein product [Paramecium primaurelia]